MKTKIRNYLYYHWWFYVISAVLVAALWGTVFAKLAEPKDYEQINITYIGSSFDHIKLQSDLEKVLPERSKQTIKRITVENAVIGGEYELNSILRSRTSGGCDFFIIESTVIEEYKVDLASYFPEVESQTAAGLFGGTEQATQGDKVFGLSLDEAGNIADYYSGKGVCEIFFNRHSVNLSDMFGGKKEQDAALAAVKYLTEVKDVQA